MDALSGILWWLPGIGLVLLAVALAYALLRPRGKQAQRDAATREVYRADEDEAKRLD